MLGRVAIVRTLIVISLAVLGIAAVNWIVTDRSTIRYRVTIAIQTPEGIKTGSSVLETTIHDETKVLWYNPDARLMRRRTRGEAIFVDLDNGRNVVALLGVLLPKLESENYDTLNTFRHTTRDIYEIVNLSYEPKSMKELDELATRTGEPAIPAEVSPLFVTFDSLDIPASARLVRPRDFASEFGPGVRLSSVTVKITDERPTAGLAEKLQWLDDQDSLGRLEEALYRWGRPRKGNMARRLLKQDGKY